jgi:hypothetical protein
VAYFSGDQSNPVLAAVHRQLEWLSRLSQDLHYAAMADDLTTLPAARLTELTRFCRSVNRQLRAWWHRIETSAGGGE